MNPIAACTEMVGPPKQASGKSTAFVCKVIRILESQPLGGLVDNTENSTLFMDLLKIKKLVVMRQIVDRINNRDLSSFRKDRSYKMRASFPAHKLAFGQSGRRLCRGCG